MDAIVIDNVVKNFRKRTIRGEYTTFKSELVRWLRGRREKQQTRYIEALRGIDLRIPAGKTVGILGRNGSGKSTLLKLITGIYAPTSGTISVNGRISALLDLGAGFHPDFSGRENILINGIILGMTRAEVKARMDEIIAFSELGDFIDEPVRTYSSGMYMRLAFSVATHVDPDILIIDEILAVGDEHFSKKSFAKMNEFKRSGKTIVLVTHDLATVERWCDLAAWIDGGRIRRVGPPSELAKEYREAIALAEAQEMSFVPAGLSETGGALPEVPAAAPPAQPPAHEPVRLTGLQLGARGGAPGEPVTPDAAIDVVVDVAADGPADGLGVAVSLAREDGVLFFGTDTLAAALALPTSGAARLRLALPRLGFPAGRYHANVHLIDASGATRGAVLSAAFEVASDGERRGIVRLPHTWAVEPAGAAPDLRTGT